MKRIWKVAWFDEDDFGPIAWKSCVLQGEGMSKEQAIREARFELFGIYVSDADDYEQMIAQELTGEKILSTQTVDWLGEHE